MDGLLFAMLLTILLMSRMEQQDEQKGHTDRLITFVDFADAVCYHCRTTIAPKNDRPLAWARSQFLGFLEDRKVCQRGDF